MKAYRMHGIGVSSLDTVDDPRPGPGQVLIAPEAAGICATDLHVLHDGVFVDADNGLPMTMGHEVVGRVLAVGETSARDTGSADDPGWREGDRVVVEPLTNCGLCDRCQRGSTNLCRHSAHLGLDTDGVWAELATVSAHRLTRMAHEVPVEQAVLAEPLACALHFLARGELRQGQSLLIVGAGPTGLLLTAAARAAGAGLIVVSDPNEARRELSRQVGADLAVDPMTTDVAMTGEELTRGAGFDLVVEAAGTPRAITDAFALPRPGGTLVLAGVCGQQKVPVDTHRIVHSEITVRGGFASRWQMPTAVHLLENQRVEVSPLVSLALPLAEAHLGMDALSRRPDLIKVVLHI